MLQFGASTYDPKVLPLVTLSSLNNTVIRTNSNLILNTEINLIKNLKPNLKRGLVVTLLGLAMVLSANIRLGC